MRVFPVRSTHLTILRGMQADACPPDGFGMGKEPRMKRYVLTVVAALVIGLSMLGSASAGDHSVSGTPGESNCHGQTMAFLAQIGQSVDIHGVGNVAKALGMSVKELQALVD